MTKLLNDHWVIAGGLGPNCHIVVIARKGSIIKFLLHQKCFLLKVLATKIIFLENTVMYVSKNTVALVIMCIYTCPYQLLSA